MRLLPILFVAALVLPAIAAATVGPLPSPRLTDRDWWYPRALLLGFHTQADACDPDGDLTQLDVTFEPYGTQSWTGVNRCAFVTFDVPAVDVRAPGTLRGHVVATDEDGLKGADVGRVRLPLLPDADLYVPGFPDLGTFDPPPMGGRVYMEFAITPEGNVRGYKFIWNGTLHGDTLSAMQPGDHRLVYDLRATAGEALARLDGAPVWIGHTRQVGHEWWHLAPIDDDSLTTPVGVV